MADKSIQMQDPQTGENVYPITITDNIYLPNGTPLMKYLNILPLPLGTLIHSTRLLNDTGLHIADGGELAIGGVYDDFCQYVISNQSEFPILYDDNEKTAIQKWQEEFNLYGQCGKYVITDTYVKIPAITKFTEGLTSTELSRLGESFEAGIPNIKGTFTNNDSFTTSGVFKNLWNEQPGGASSGGSYDLVCDFDASRASTVYGKSDTVQPQSTKYPYYIVVATVTKTEIEVNINNIIADLNNKAEKSQLVNLERTTVLYDKTSADANINWGQTSGIKGGVSIAPKSNFVAYKRLRFHILFASYQTEIDELDMEMPIPNNTAQRRTTLSAISGDDTSSHYASIITYNTSSNNMYMEIGYVKGTSFTNRNNNSGYYIYKIEGVY